MQSSPHLYFFLLQVSASLLVRDLVSWLSVAVPDSEVPNVATSTWNSSDETSTSSAIMRHLLIPGIMWPIDLARKRSLDDHDYRIINVNSLFLPDPSGADVDLPPVPLLTSEHRAPGQLGLYWGLPAEAAVAVLCQGQHLHLEIEHAEVLQY